MVVNQAHLGCHKSVALSLDSSRPESRLTGFEELSVQIEGSLWDGDYLSQFCSYMKITFCNGSACTWNETVII